jgi:hypothetical protein
VADLRGRLHLFGPALTAQIYAARRCAANAEFRAQPPQPLRFTAAEEKSLQALAANIYRKRAQRRADEEGPRLNLAMWA